MKIFYLLTALLFCSTTYCGTLIYKGANNEKKIISEIDILSIDKNILTFKIGKVTRAISLSKMFKYYDTDINMNLAFDDNTSDYTIHISGIKPPINRRGITVKKGKKGGRQVNTFDFEFHVSPKPQKNQSRAIKYPYFYLYILTAGQETSGRSMYTFCYPKDAKTKNSKTYNEALMLEKAISSERHTYDPHYIRQSMTSRSNVIKIPLTGIGNREIIAYHLVVWGKDDIIYTKGDILNRQYKISPKWYLMTRTIK